MRLQNFHRVTPYFIILILLIVNLNSRWNPSRINGVIASDGKGYYAYLPAVFIYHDLNFDFFEKIEKGKYYNKDSYYDYRSASNGKTINKYYCGTAIAELPFFLLANFLTKISGGDADGYSNLYQLAISIAALFYLFIGLIFLNKVLKIYLVNEWNRTFTLLSCVFGTNLFYYVVTEPSMSHVFSFSFISMFVYYSKRLFLELEEKHLPALVLFLGIIILIRPVNCLILLTIPFLAGNFSSLILAIKKNLKSGLIFFLSILILIAIISIQLIIYKISTGSFLIYSYGQEKFNFNDPHIIDILFSYKKGLFLYTPLYLFSLAGLYPLYNKSKYQFFSILFFLFILIYIISSWWMWYYGGSFSSRVFIDFLPLFMILLGIFLNKAQKNTFRKLYLSILFLLITLCQIQTYQYRYSQIHWSEMTKEKYWNVFLRIDKL